MRRPNSSPARRVNLLIMEHAPRIAKRKSRKAVQTQTLQKTTTFKHVREIPTKLQKVQYHAVHAKKSLCPTSFLSFAKLYMNVYISTVGSATPSMSNGCPPKIEWITPHNAVDASVCTAVKLPSGKKTFQKPLEDQSRRWVFSEVLENGHLTSVPFQLLAKRYYWDC